MSCLYVRSLRASPVRTQRISSTSLLGLNFSSGPMVRALQ